MSPTTAFDYSLTGPEAERAEEIGLVDAQWYRSPISSSQLQDLTRRSTSRAAIDLLLWVALLVLAGVLIWLARDSWMVVPAFLVYAALYGGSADARWHEFGHGTATSSDRLNNLAYYSACFMLLREPTVWRWSHFRHHGDTIVRGRDAEIVFPRPFARMAWVGNLVGLLGVPTMLKRIVKHAGGTVGDAEKSYIPTSEQRKVVIEARAYLVLLAGVIALSVVTRSIMPLLYVGLPTFFGSWLVLFFGTTQHAGLRENVLDYRENTRTVLMNPVFRFLYLNMNYHVEHHMYPSVPYRNLPKLHEVIKHDLPLPCSSMLAAYREIFQAVQAQQTDPAFELPRSIPTTAERPSVELLHVAIEEDGWLLACDSNELEPESDSACRCR